MRRAHLIDKGASTFVLMLVLATPAFGGSDTRARLAEEYGLDFVDGIGADIFEPEELASFAGILRALPEELSKIAKRTRFGRIRVTKTEAPSTESPAPLPWLHWQMELDLSEVSRAASPSRVSDAARKRVLVRNLLETYDALSGTSQSAGWRQISGWRDREYFGFGIPLLPKEALNQDPRGYAYKRIPQTAAEDFVRFGEIFFVTPDSLVEDSIKCRTPEKYRFFKRLFPTYRGYLDRDGVRCRDVAEGFLDDLQFLDPVTGRPIDMGRITSETVEGFELLYATPGVGDAAEIAGHLILRIKLHNNPQARRLGIENPKDLVVSFLADTEDLGGHPHGKKRADEIPQACRGHGGLFDLRAGGGEFEALRSIVQPLKGLSGGFLTSFDRQTLEFAIKSYTVRQDRNLLRYRLVLSDAQKQGLIERLYVAKKNFKSKYYFFDRNCASILVQIIGEGIGDREVAEFDPFVVPPNSLVAMLLRKGLAEPVHPAFYSYRRRGYVAQDLLKEHLALLNDKAPQLSWPTYEEFLSDEDEERQGAVLALAKLRRKAPELSGTIYRMASLIQEAELVHADHEEICQEVTTETTAASRALQREILGEGRMDPASLRVDVNHLVYSRYRDAEERQSRLGSEHTRLASLYAGAGIASREKDGRKDAVGVVSIRGALHLQDMGSVSSQAMSRGTSVRLGEAEIDLEESKSVPGSAAVSGWRLTGMEIRKFKERLHGVPGYFGPDGRIGLGLTLLDLEGDPKAGRTRGTVVGGELLFNLFSSPLHDRFAYLSLGADLDTLWLRDKEEGWHIPGNRHRILFPLRMEALWTFDQERLWQMRADVEWSHGRIAGEAIRGLKATSSLVRRLEGLADQEFALRLDLSLKKGPEDPDARSLLRLGLEWNRW